MSVLLAQLPALIGVLVGTLGTILATSLADRSRWRRSQRVRWDERRLEVCVEFSRVVKEIHAVSLRMIAAERPASRGHRIDREEGLTRLADADVRHTLAWESLLLLGDAATVSAARTWRDAVWEIERVARGLPGPPVVVADLVRRADQGRDDFYRAARGDLGVRGGSVTQSDWLADRRHGWLDAPGTSSVPTETVEVASTEAADPAMPGR
ncbi:hypothetical protein [Micromonospora rosaria]|uniref:hypothetical protein n=1 Tax=Micromonospora rosaria TaxID=47874 RepID=UPI001FE1F5BC|nr:hypothetical protein [Micromonospora rosaria]